MAHAMFDALIVVSILLSIPAALYSLECFGSSIYIDEPIDKKTGVKSVVLIPAHNEEAGIVATLSSLKSQLEEHDRILVIADNCSDSTAAVARDAGVDVVERSHDSERGKGYALAHGIDQLRDSPPDVVLIVDADCDVSQGSLQQLKSAAIHYDRPVQGRYLIQSPEGANISTKVSELAVMIRNRARCKGMSAMGIPVPLLGTGMAFKWADITLVPLASGEIVEDMKLGVELAKAGRGATYLDSAIVTSEFPSSEEALLTQRERWEHGHLDILRRFVLPNVGYALAHFDFRLLFFTLDLAIPPLTLMLALHLALTFVAFIAALAFGTVVPFMLFVCGFLSMSAGLVFAWSRYGKTILPAKELINILSYVVSKFSIYTRFITKRQTKWIRTDRDTKK